MVDLRDQGNHQNPHQNVSAYLDYRHLCLKGIWSESYPPQIARKQICTEWKWPTAIIKKPRDTSLELLHPICEQWNQLSTTFLFQRQELLCLSPSTPAHNSCMKADQMPEDSSAIISPVQNPAVSVPALRLRYHRDAIGVRKNQNRTHHC